MGQIAAGKGLDQNQNRKTHVKKTKFTDCNHLYGTYRFGEYGFLLGFDTINNDKIKFRVGSEVNSYTLKAPLLTPIAMNKVYIQVPRMAILPLNWEKIHTNPSIGQDIDAQEYGTSWKPELINNLFETLIDNYNEQGIVSLAPDDLISALIEVLSYEIHNLTTLELWFSNGSLVNAMGAHFARLWDSGKYSFDEYFQKFIDTIKKHFGMILIQANKDDRRYNVKLMENIPDDEYNKTITQWNINQWLEELRDGETFEIIRLYTKEGIEIEANESIEDDQATLAFYNEWSTFVSSYTPSKTQYGKPFDTGTLWAYQLGAAEFFTNDKVDYVYNAELFRQYIGDITMTETPRVTFTLNGLTYEADYLSAAQFEALLANASFEYVRQYLFAMMKYGRSLKYKDYFTGARTRPIAVGNTDIAVTAGDHVEVVNVAVGIQRQRFLNVINKVGRELKNYDKAIFGADVAPDWHSPLYLGSTREVIYGQEIENTGEAQVTEAQSRTSVLKNQGKNYQFELKSDRDSIIVGYISFDIPRAYSKGVQRKFMHVDRYDFYNPYLQYTGDQEVYGEELDVRETETFGYQGSYMEFKQWYNEAFGGFIQQLKGWTFLDQYVEADEAGTHWDYGMHISPDFIRSKPSELDRFYISLAGNTMANYFHFIIDNTIYIEAIRPMSYNPQILG